MVGILCGAWAFTLIVLTTEHGHGDTMKVHLASSSLVEDTMNVTLYNVYFIIFILISLVLCYKINYSILN